MQQFMDDEVVEFYDCYCKKETDRAMLIHITGTGDEAWIPKSQIVNMEEVEEKRYIKKLTITKWIAQQKQLI